MKKVINNLSAVAGTLSRSTAQNATAPDLSARSANVAVACDAKKRMILYQVPNREALTHALLAGLAGDRNAQKIVTQSFELVNLLNEVR